jgi:hypothetical protein
MNVWPVDDDGHCTCYLSSACRRPGKHADPEAPENDAYAVLCGPGGVLVVDVDVKGGVDGFAQLAEWNLPATLEVHTPSGGRHLYYRHPGGVLANKKLASAIDVRANPRTEGGHSYVVGPGSPGYTKTSDPCTVVEAEPYEIDEDVPIADAPADLVAWLKIDAEQEQGDAVAPIDESHPAWDTCVRGFTEDCKTHAPSQEDGNASGAMMAIVRRGARRYQLPDDKALELLLEHWNPRCTRSDGATPYPWNEQELARALRRSRESGPGHGMAEDLLAREQGTDLAWKMRAHARAPNATPRPPSAPEGTTPLKKTKIGAGYENDGERKKISQTAVASMLYRWPDWDGVLCFDVLKRRPFAIDPPVLGKMTLEQGQMSRGDLAQIRLWFDAHGYQVSRESVEEGLWTVVRQPDRQRNFIAEYLDGLPPVDGVKHLSTLATDVLGATDPFANTLVAKTLVAAVRRARTPGHRHRAMLVLKGDQYCGKTAFVKILAGPFYHSTGNGNLAERDTILECQGAMFVEVEELSALNKADENALKTAVSREVDVITKKYEPDGQSYPRSFVLVGTTNKDEFLTDSTGDTRYWVVEIPAGAKVDLERLIALRDTLWAEADLLARTNVADWNELKDEEDGKKLEASNAAFRSVHPWIEEVRKFLAGKQEVRTLEDVLAHVLKGDMTKADKRAKNDVADLMRALGCQNRRRSDGRSRYWKVPAEISGAKPGRVVGLPKKESPH